MSWIVYILECADTTLYIGITKNLDHRIRAHTNGKGAKYTRGRGPFSVLYTESRTSLSQALRREAQLKKFDHGQKLAFIAAHPQSVTKVKRLLPLSNGAPTSTGKE